MTCSNSVKKSHTATRTGNGLVLNRVPCRNSHMSLSWYFLCSLACSPVLADQAVNDLSARDPGGHIDRPVDLVQRGSSSRVPAARSTAPWGAR
jgi:hypothetical protein